MAPEQNGRAIDRGILVTRSCILVCLLFLGCVPIEEPLFCSKEVRPGIRVEVRDSLTGEPAACGATLLLQDRKFSEIIEPNSRDCSTSPWDSAEWLQGAFERVGVYNVIVRKPGYVDWLESGVVVTKDRCHVRTRKLEAMLTRDD